MDLRQKKVSFSGILMLIYMVWFMTPVLRYLFGGVLNYAFMALFVAGLLLYVIVKKKNAFVFSTPLVWVLVFCLCFTFMVATGLGNAAGSVRILLSYWMPLVAFIQLEEDEEETAVYVKVLMLVFIITVLTTFVNLLEDPRLARALTSSDTEKELSASYRLKNCGDIYLIQGMVLLVPMLVNNVAKKIYAIPSLIGVVFIGFMLVHASFTTALLIYIITLVLSLIFNSKLPGVAKGILVVFCMSMAFLNLNSILDSLYRMIPNDLVRERLSQLMEMNQGEETHMSRPALYRLSFNTFRKNWMFGIGPYYFVWDRRIGNHSQILDDLARYGMAGLVFYIGFFSSYFKMLKKRWAVIKSESVVVPYMVALLLFLSLNPGLRGNMESIITLFLMPGLPLVLRERMEKNKAELTES